MVTDKTTITVKRFKLTLYELTEKLEKTGEPICQLGRYSATFALNSIPLATVSPVLSREISDKGEASPIFEKLVSLEENRAPVGVFLEITQGFTSNDNKSKSIYWPDNRSKAPTPFGEYTNSRELCIFKGYLTPMSKEITAFNASCTVSIRHWLSSLAMLSMLTSAFHTSSPAELSMQFYNLFEDANKTWSPTYENSFNIDNLTNMWETGIKSVFESIINKSESLGKDEKLNKLTEVLRARVKVALDKIKTTKEDYLEIPTIQVGSQTLKQYIRDAIRREPMLSFIQQTAWNKLVDKYMPMFLFSLCPRVDDALLIPMPCVVIKEGIKELNSDDLFSVSAISTSDSIMAAMTCVTQRKQADGTMGSPHFINNYTYPKSPTKQGVYYTTAFPDWIMAIEPTPESDTNMPLNTDDEDELERNQKEVKEKQDIETKAENEMRLVSEQYTKMAYLINLLKSTRTTIRVPVRMDICPGACLKISAKGFVTENSSDINVDIYGTVASVSVSFSADNTPDCTEITLTNIRNDRSVDDEIDNPQKNVGFYKSVFTGNNEVLYAE